MFWFTLIPYCCTTHLMTLYPGQTVCASACLSPFENPWSRVFVPFCCMVSDPTSLISWPHHWSTDQPVARALFWLNVACFRSGITLHHRLKRVKGSWMHRNLAHNISRIWLTNCNKTRNDLAFAWINWQPLVWCYQQRCTIVHIKYMPVFCAISEFRVLSTHAHRGVNVCTGGVNERKCNVAELVTNYY